MKFASRTDSLHADSVTLLEFVLNLKNFLISRTRRPGVIKALEQKGLATLVSGHWSLVTGHWSHWSLVTYSLQLSISFSIFSSSRCHVDSSSDDVTRPFTFSSRSSREPSRAVRSLLKSSTRSTASSRDETTSQTRPRNFVHSVYLRGEKGG